MMPASLKSVSSMKLHRNLVVTQRTAWFMPHGLRLALNAGSGVLFNDLVMVDQTCVGGKEAEQPEGEAGEC